MEPQILFIEEWALLHLIKAVKKVLKDEWNCFKK